MNQTRPARRPPSVDQVLPMGGVAAARFGHAATVKAIRQGVAAVRDAATAAAQVPAAEAIAARALRVLEHADAPSLRRVFKFRGSRSQSPPRSWRNLRDPVMRLASSPSWRS